MEAQRTEMMDMDLNVERWKYIRTYNAALEAELAEAERRYAAQKPQIKAGRQRGLIAQVLSVVAGLVTAHLP